MAPYHAIKLIKLDKSGTPNLHAKTYGLFEIEIGPPDKLHKSQNIIPNLLVTYNNPKILGMNYGAIMHGTYDPSSVSLSFESPFDIVSRSTEGKNLQIYKAENLPINLRERFIEGMFEEIIRLRR